MPQVMEFKLPDLGEGLTEAEIVRWLVAVGDVVAIDQPVVEVETAKAMVEVPCPYGGVVTARFGEEGTELPVGAPLITVAVGASSLPEAPAAQAAEAEGSGNVPRPLIGYGEDHSRPARRRRVRPVTAAVSAPVVVAAPAAPVVSAGPVPVISPLVRKLAKDGGVDLRALKGSGPEGLILRADVEAALAALRAPEPPRPPRWPRRWRRRASGSRSRACAVRSPRSCRAAAGRSRTPPAGSTPTPPS